jgi:hypothetical protein
MSTTMHALSAAVLAMSLALSAYAADVTPTDKSTPSPVQPAPRDTTQVPSTEPQSRPDNQSDETVKDGGARDEEANYLLALRECQPLPSPERERCIDKAKEKYGRM